MNFEEPPALTACETCRYIAEQGGTTTALDAYEVLRRTQANLHARIEELEGRLAHSIGRELVILTQLRECIWVLEQSHGEGARVAERAKAVMTGEEEQP